MVSNRNGILELREARDLIHNAADRDRVGCESFNHAKYFIRIVIIVGMIGRRNERFDLQRDYRAIRRYYSFRFNERAYRNVRSHRYFGVNRNRLPANNPLVSIYGFHDSCEDNLLRQRLGSDF